MDLVDAVKEHKRSIWDHEKRIRALELFHARVAAWASIGALVGGILAHAVIGAVFK